MRARILTGSASHPLCVEPGSGTPSLAAFLDLVTSRIEWIDEQLRRHGAVLFRGFALREPEHLEAFLAAAGYRPMPYVRGAGPRRKVSEAVYTSTEIHPRIDVGVHSELSYASVYPSKIAFLCHTPALQDGETPLADTRRLYARIAPGVRSRFEAHGVRYIQNVPERPRRPRVPSWHDVFESSDRAAVEAICRAQGFECLWRPGGSLRLTHVRPSVLSDPTSNEPCWFNQAHLWHCCEVIAGPGPAATLRSVARAIRRGLVRRLHSAEQLPLHAEYGDGSAMPVADVNHVRRAIHAETVPFRWQAGDLLVLDNFKVAHGRRPFRGPRRIYTSLVA